MTPLYAVLNVEWAPKMFYPQPRAQLQQQTSYLELMKALLDKGADPNARMRTKIWYTQYNFDLLRIDEGGATPFWRAAYASDIDAMKLLLSYGADPNIPTMQAGGRRPSAQGGTRSGDDVGIRHGLPPVPTGGPGIAAAAGRGRRRLRRRLRRQRAPLRADRHARRRQVPRRGAARRRQRRDERRQHRPAPRGVARRQRDDQYLVSKGADVKPSTAADRRPSTWPTVRSSATQPYPETIKLLEGLGAKNNHKCVSC